MKIKQKRAFTNQSWEQVAVPPGDGRCRALGMFRQMLEGTRPSGRSGAQGAGAGGGSKPLEGPADSQGL